MTLIERPRPFAVIDVETTKIEDGKIPETLFWGFANSKGYERFSTTKDLFRFLKAIPQHTLLHHYNYDIIQSLIDGEREIQIHRSHNTKLLRCKLEKHLTINTGAAFPVKLEKIFNAFGYEKTELPESDFYDSHLLSKRNYEDCVNGLDSFLKLDDLFYKVCGVHPLEIGTVAGTSFKAAQNFIGEKMPINTEHLEAYRGGRTEVYDCRMYANYETMDAETLLLYEQYGFDRLHKHCSKFDINSSYPKSILDCPEKGELLFVEIWTKDWHCPFFDCNTQEMLLFPNGHFYSYVFADVFQKYIEPHMERTRIKVKKRFKIDFKWLNGLKGFINTIYQLKCTTPDPGIKEVCKFLLNAFYGRIGLKGESERVRILDYVPDKEGLLCQIGRKRWLFFDKIFRQDVKANYPFVAYITDNARGRLFRAIKTTPQTIYGDTDSIITPGNYFGENQGGECGAWKDETKKEFIDKYHRAPINNEEKQACWCINVKDYFWGGKEIRKGGKKFLQWTLKTAFGENGRGVAHEVIRTRQTQLRKRKVLPSGETMPLEINYTA